MKQSQVFLDGEGDAWHQRNIMTGEWRRNHLMDALTSHSQILPGSVLEFGCGTGWRLEAVRQQFGSSCFGIDPSKEAIELGKEAFPELNLSVGTTSCFESPCELDLIIFGFCLYLVDRADLFSAVQRADYLLKEGGYLAIHDFSPKFPEVKPYHHKEGVFSYKMDHAKLWLANPAYELVTKVRITGEESITILRKNSWERFGGGGGSGK